jgi:alpha-galactosidase
MRLEPVAVQAAIDGAAPDRTAIDGPGHHRLGALAVELAVAGSGATTSCTWAVVNRGDRPVAVRHLRLVFAVLGDGLLPDADGGGLRMLQHGWQSWSPTASRAFGVDDPSRAAGSIPLVRDMLHADPAPTGPGELRSEMVTVLAAEGGLGEPVLVGFDGGSEHDGTLRLVPGAATVELHAEAYFGGAVLEPGERRPLHGLTVATGESAHVLLVAWAERCGRAANARVTAPFQVGWCSWYHYFHDVTEQDVRDNLALASDWPFDVYQVDDGYQRHIGDWLLTADTFPSGIDQVASEISSRGFVPGLWLAPFVASPSSVVADEHPEYFARELHRDRALMGMFHEKWDGAQWALDTTRADVQAHLEQLGRDLVSAGYRYLKLDFTFAPTVQGAWSDSSKTPAQRVRAGYDAIRRGAGDDTFILGCGAPLGALVGVVDGMRIGPDVAPSWKPDPERVFPGYHEQTPSVENAWRSTDVRSFLHRRLWLNDPDCVMLRTKETELTEQQVRDWALAVGRSGGMVLASDDLALLDEGAHRLLDEVIETGRAADLEAVNGYPPECVDLLTDDTPLQLRSAAP